MSELRITYDHGFQVQRSADGRGPWTNLGPRWPTPKEAGRHFDREFHKNQVSPLRAVVDVPPSTIAPSGSDPWTPLAEAHPSGN